ncbi:sialate O-acetylesterase [Sphingomonas sp. MS122]|uniref:sialate O-acetylesterase n=1 Tax=Sphingomonas sp. MS122 TaxID=3412683 RepID=UPI003C2EAF2A
MRTALAILALGVAAIPVAAQTLTVAPHLASHMVIQHGAPAQLRGTAKPGEQVSVTFGSISASGRADAEGRWQVTLPSLPPGQAGAVVIRAASGETMKLDDVVAGDVWLCSGQSNMDLPVSGSANPERTIRESAGSTIRILKIRRIASVTPQRDVVPEIPWSRAAPENLGGFSAACWHMARRIVAGGVNVPVGLIQASWGGSTIEDWMPPAALRAAGTPAAQLDWLSRYAVDREATLVAAATETDRWAEAVDPATSSWSAAAFDDSGWQTMAVPGQWERSGIDGLGGFDGIMWFRTAVTLTIEQIQQGATLHLGRIDERDRVWVNGTAVGGSVSGSELRAYRLPPGVLKAGANVIAVRVIDEMGGGGFSGPANLVKLAFEDGQDVPLAGSWRYRKASSDSKWGTPPPFIPWSMPRGLTMAWNGMVAPLAGTRLRGIAWYQGESNTSRAGTYRALLTAWRSAWRAQFQDQALPIVIVQLPGYGPMASQPVDAPWARLREMQRLAALDDRATGLAVSIDLGLASDIHPAHKDVIGERMGREALRVAYAKPLPAAPQPVAARRTAAGIEIDMADVTGGLLVYGAAEPTAFELCNAAGACRFARARVEGARLLILDDSRPATEIRYAWQGSPPVNLYAQSGWPVSPFRIVISD